MRQRESGGHRHGDRIEYLLAFSWSEFKGLNPGADFGFAVDINGDGRMKGSFYWPAGTDYAIVHCVSPDGT